MGPKNFLSRMENRIFQKISLHFRLKIQLKFWEDRQKRSLKWGFKKVLDPLWQDELQGISFHSNSKSES